jgi:hypothetical protein
MNSARLQSLKRTFAALATLAACTLLFSCSEQDNQISTTSNQPGAGTTPASPSATSSSTPSGAQTSKALVSANPEAQYLIIKQTFDKLIPDSELASARQEAFPGEPYDLEDCGRGPDYVDLPDDDPFVPLAELGYKIVFLRKSLAKLGYPEAVWQPLIVQFENEQLTLLLQETGKASTADPPSLQHYYAFRQKMVQALRDYREQVAPDLPEVIYEGGCGAGEIAITVKTDPADGRVIFIPVFFFQLCQAQQINPADPSQCDRWREAAEDVPFEVSGDYFYRAYWPGGVEKQGRLSFTKLEDGQTVTFRKP